jgi:hypothetical protein
MSSDFVHPLKYEAHVEVKLKLSLCLSKYDAT